MTYRNDQNFMEQLNIKIQSLEQTINQQNIIIQE